MKRWWRCASRKRDAEKAAFEHASERADLTSLLADHMIAESTDSMTGWIPTRRGNSGGKR